MNDACSRFLVLPDQLQSSIAVEPVKEMVLCSLLPWSGMRKTRLKRFTQRAVKSKSFQSFITSLNQASTFVTFAIQITVTTIQYNTRNLLTYISQNHLFIHIFSDLWVTFRSQNLELQSTIFHQLFHVRWKFLPLNDFFSFSHFFMN